MTDVVRQAFVSSTSEMRQGPREAGRYLVAFTWEGGQERTEFEFTVEVVVMPNAGTEADRVEGAELVTASETTAPEGLSRVSPLGWVVGTGLGLLAAAAAVITFLRRRRTAGNTANRI